MQSLNNSLFNPHFSHIYVEKESFHFPVTQKIINRFPKSELITIDHYKDIFCRSRQNYLLQKQSPALILAVKHGTLIYPGSPVCENFGNEHFYYTSSVMNCLYDCEYCYLQGMYSSANVVVFVNLDDIFSETDLLLKKYPVYLCISYDTDLLALENILGYVTKWYEFAKARPELKIELRTKSANFRSLSSLAPIPNMILAWTLSPAFLSKTYEHNTPGTSERLANIKDALKYGWKVRLCFDPLLREENWKELYCDLIEKTFSSLSAENLFDISIGGFRVSKEYLKKMRKQRPFSAVLQYPFDLNNGFYQYPEKHLTEMILFLKKEIQKWIPEEKIYI